MYTIIAETSDKNCVDDISRQKPEEPTETRLIIFTEGFLPEVVPIQRTLCVCVVLFQALELGW